VYKRQALHDADKTKFPNLAIMKLSAHHRSLSDDVHWYCSDLDVEYDKIYSSKVFTFTDPEKLNGNIEYGGSGYFDIHKKLPDHIEHICPDYLLYGLDYSMGFLTRGCIRRCSFCIVPKKEGWIKKHADIDEFIKHKHVTLMDNNVLASDHGVDQIKKISNMNIKVDFNQGLDARLIDHYVAKKLSKLKWWKPLRLACDNHGQIPAVQNAVTLLRWHNVTPRRYFVYCLIRDPDESLERIKILKGMNLDVYAQPYRDTAGNLPTKEQRDIARWVNHKAIFKSVSWEYYKK